MAYSKKIGRLFSVSDDGQFIINDLNEQKIVSEYQVHKSKNPIFGSKYVPVYRLSSKGYQHFIQEGT